MILTLTKHIILITVQVNDKRRMRSNRRERRPVVYTNETWANSHDDILQVERKETYASQHVKVTD